jgi:hypothetical protein
MAIGVPRFARDDRVFYDDGAFCDDRVFYGDLISMELSGTQTTADVVVGTLAPMVAPSCRGPSLRFAQDDKST